MEAMEAARDATLQLVARWEGLRHDAETAQDARQALRDALALHRQLDQWVNDWHEWENWENWYDRAILIMELDLLGFDYNNRDLMAALAAL